MNIKLFATKYSQLLNKALDVYARQHKAISENVANASDPGFQRVNPDFSQSLRQAEAARLKQSSSRHIGSSGIAEGPVAVTGNGTGTPVDLTREMAELAELQIKHDLVTRALNKYYAGVGTAITGRQS